MKIVVTVQGQDLGSKLDPQFGRAQGYIVVDTESGEQTFVDNTENMNLPQGAGLQTAQAVANTGAEVVVTGRVGPKAMAILEKSNMRVFESGPGTAQEALNAFLAQ